MNKYLFIFICVPKLTKLPNGVLLSAELLGFYLGEFVSRRLVGIPKSPINEALIAPRDYVRFQV